MALGKNNTKRDHVMFVLTIDDDTQIIMVSESMDEVETVAKRLTIKIPNIVKISDGPRFNVGYKGGREVYRIGESK